MPSRSIRTRAIVCALAALALALASFPARAQDAQSQPEAAPSTDPKIGFAFKNAPFDQVLDFFSRQSGVPIIFEADPPQGPLTFVSAQDYTLADAISVMNLTLRRHDRYLRHEGDFLYLSTLPEAAKRAGESFETALPDGVTPDQIVTMTIPLSNASAALVAEQIKPLLDAYGSVTPVPEQNIVIIVETAAQIERLSQVIQTIDERRPVDASYKLFPLRHAQAETVVEALRGLVGTRVQRIIIDQNGQQRVVEDLDVGGLSIQPDVRTNSVIAVGPDSRIQTVEELIALLDSDGSGAAGGRRLITLPLRATSPQSAAQRIGQLYEALEPAQRPTVVPLEEAGKVAVVASDEQLVQITALIDELDPGRGTGAALDEELARVLTLRHLSAESAASIASRLLTPRQQAMLRIVPGSDGRSLVVAGEADEVDRFQKLLEGIDRPAAGAREVRLVRIDAADAGAVQARAERLFASAHPEPARLERTFDALSGSLTLIGDRADIDEYVRLLGEAQKTASLATESKTYEVANESPEELAARLSRIVAVVLGDRGSPPSIQPIPELDQIIVRAQPAQFQLIDSLVAQLTQRASGDVEVEVVRLHTVDPEALIARAQEFAALAHPAAQPAAVQHDAESGNLIVTGVNESVRAFSEGLGRAQSLTPPARTTRYIDVQRANAMDLVEPLRALLASADPIDPGRRVPDPTITAVERTNSLLVVAEEAQHEMIADQVRRLDVLEQTDLPPLRLLQLRTAEAQSIAAMLSEQYRQRPQPERTAMPVEIRADASTNTLIVAAHEELFAEIRSFVEDLNTAQSDGPERVTKLFPLRVARASDVALAMDRLYPEPPVPLDRRGVPMPWLREPKQVTVSAEENSNSLIIDAPADRMESLTELAEQLDRVQVPAAAELRTYRVENADLDVIAKALSGLAARGILSSPAQAGRQQVQVLIETEPRSKTLIVAGDEVTFEKVEQMLADLSAVPVERELRVIPVSGQLASDIAARAQQIYAAQTRTIPDAKPVEIKVDEHSNTLEVIAETESMERFLSVLDELQSQTGPARQIRLVELRASKAEVVTGFLNELLITSAAIRQHGGPMPTFEPIASTNSILISATGEDWAVIEPLVRSLDTAEGQDRPPLRILRLRSTDAESIAQVLQQSFDRRSAAERARLPVDIRSDASTNTLMVSAHQDVLPEIEGLVADLNDAQAIDGEGRGIQIFPLKIARAEDLARTIDQMYPEPPMPVDSRGRPRPDLRLPKEIVVRADPATNALIVDAPAARLPGFEQLVRELDRAQATEDVEVRTYAIRRAELASVQATLRELADRNALGVAGRTPVTITAEGRGRTLVVSGPVGIFDQVESLIASLDAPPELPGRVLRFYRLEHARADRLAPMIREALAEQARQTVGQQVPAGEEVLTVSADAGSNTLIISAPELVQEIAAELVEALDSEASAGSRSIVRVVPLTYADAASVAPTLIAAASAMDLAPADRPLVSAVGGVNAVVLSGPKADVEKVAELIASLDVRPTGAETPGVETFELEHASASEIAQTVQRLLVNQLETDPRVMASRLRYIRDAAPPAPTVRVEADQRTNALIVSAPTATLDLARSIVERLDTPAGEQPTMMTFTPARGGASRLAQVAGDVLSRTRTPNVPPAELHVVPSSGSVVVTGQPDEVARAVAVLSEFDERSLALPESSMRLIEIESASAESVARTLTGLLADRARWPRELREAEESGLPVAAPSFSAEPGTNQILAVAAEPLLKLAEEVARSLDAGAEGSVRETRVFALTQGDAESVASALKASLGAAGKPGRTPAAVTAERVSNSVVVVGDPEQVGMAEELIAQMDEAIDTDGVSVRTVSLKHARAEALAPIIEEIVRREDATQLLPSWMMASYLAQGGSVRQPARVVAEPRLNALVITGPTPVLDLAEQVALELDAPAGTGTTERPVRVITLRNADAAGVAGTIEAMFAEDAAASTPPIVRVDTEANALVVRGDAAQLERVNGLVRELDEAAVLSGRQLRRIAVDPARMEAGELAEILRGMLQERSGTTVEVIDATDLRPREKPADPEKGACLDPSGHPLHRIAEALAAVVTAQTPAIEDTAEASEEGETEPDVTITVDPATNSLIITGSTTVTERLARLAEEIQRQAPASPTRARIIRLPDGVDPGAVAAILTRTVQQVGVRNESNPGGFSGRVAAAPDPASGSVVVWANDADFASVGPLIAAMAEPASAESRVVKVYPLETVRAARAVIAVRDFVSPAPSGRQAQRIRSATIALDDGEGGVLSAELDPALISVAPGPGDRSIIVSAPGESLPAIDRFISLIDQSPTLTHMGIRRYTLARADAASLTRTLTDLFVAQRQLDPELPRPAIVADERSNTLLVTATTSQHEEIERLLPELDGELARDEGTLEIFRLTQNRPSAVLRALGDVVLADDPQLRSRIRMSADDGVGVLMVRAAEDDLGQIRSIIADLDRTSAQQLPVRTLTVERADAGQVASAITRFFADRDRAASRGSARSVPSVAITADSRSGSIVVAASDEDFAQIESLVKTFDGSPEAKDLVYRVFRLQHARSSDLGQMVQNIGYELQYERMWGQNPQGGNQDRLFVEANDRLNAIVVLASPDRIETIERVIAELDVPMDEMGEMTLKAIVLQKSDAAAVSRVIRESTATPGWRIWQGRDPEAVVAEVDRKRNAVLLIGRRERVELASGFVDEIERAGGEGGDRVSTIRLEHAGADRAASAISRFFQSRAQAQGVATTGVTVVGSTDGNVLVVAASESDTALIRTLVEDIDRPELGDDRAIEVYILRNANVSETSRTVTSMFPALAGRAEDRVIVTPQLQSRSLIVSAPEKLHASIKELIAELDRPPTDADSRIVTVTLKSALATSVAASLRQALPENVQVKVTPVERSNSLLLTGSEEAIELVMQHIAKLDEEPVRHFMEFRRVRLEHADAFDVASTLRTITRARPAAPDGSRAGIDYNSDDNTLAISALADELSELLAIVEELDVPGDSGRRTEFVSLEFANATQIAEALETFFGPYAPAAKTPGARRVSIVPDAASNSLVISADEKEWDSVMSLLATLDSEKYDTSRQLAVIRLEYADAQSVAGALDEGFRATVDAQLRREQARQQNRQQASRDNQPAPTPVLVRAEDLPTVSAEGETNSLVVFASRKDLERIRSIVEQIDRAEFAKYPEARIIPITQGRPSQIAVAVRELYGRQSQGSQSQRGVLVFGDDASGTLIVRSDERTFAQIEALAEAVQSQSDRRNVSVRVLALESAPASRVRTALLEAFQRTAEARGESLSIQVDRTTNALVIASTQELYDEISRTALELDGQKEQGQPEGEGQATPGVFGGMRIVDIRNNDPSNIVRLLTELGVTRPQSPDLPGIVADPVQLSVLGSRRAVAISGNPADVASVSALITSIDVEAIEPAHAAEVVPLEVAEAAQVVGTLREMLTPASGASGSSPATAAAEHLRRLSVSQGAEEPLVLDLAAPIRILAEPTSNAVIIASTEANVRGVRELAKMMDRLPVGEAVVIRVFPLNSASADRLRTILEELFRQGAQLGASPGTDRRTLPSTATGQALQSEIAMSVDERSNSLIVAGREESVALVEVLIGDLDGEQATSWVEPALIPLKHADPREMADRLSAVLVQGLTDTPESEALRRQAGRIRLAAAGAEGEAVRTADLFTAAGTLIIEPEPNVRALLVLGSPANIEVVRGLASMMDVEASDAANRVRLFPLEHAAADRVLGIVTGLFNERSSQPSFRQEDRLIAAVDARTNTLIVSTSPASFEVLEALLTSIDTADPNYAVGLHVIAIEGGDAVQLAPKIERLMRERIAATQRSGSVASPLDTFTIEPEPATNSLIIAASDENLVLVRELVAALTGEEAQTLSRGSTVEVIALTSTRPEDAAEAVNEFYVVPENQRRGPGSVGVIANERLNALVVRGTPEDIEAVRELVSRIDTATPLAVQNVRRIELKTANAFEVVQLLDEVLSGRAISGARVRTGQAVKLRFYRQKLLEDLAEGEQFTETEIDAVVREQVALTPELRTNSVLVSAPPSVMVFIESMIQDLDTTTAGTRKIEKFRLVNADARAMADVLRNLFSLRQSSSGGNLYLVPTSQGDVAQNPDDPSADSQSLTPVPDDRQQPAITIDARTNTLIVSGTEESIELVREVVEELDSIVATEREQIVFDLQYARADSVEQTLQSYFQTEASRIRDILSPGQGGSFSRQLDQEVTVVGDPLSQKVLISASPRYIDTVRKIVAELDAPPPQVIIQVLLAEVTLDDSDQWGLSADAFNVGGDNYDIGFLGAGASLATALGVPNLSVSSNDFSLLVRALQAQGKLEILSNPRLTVNNNESASIQVGENVALPDEVETLTDGRTRASIRREDVGVLLSVTPSISSDGFVRLDIQPEISVVTERTTQISEDFEAPIISTRKVDTTVTVRDGQTVVIGGLIQTTQQDRHTKVPLLGDIPLIGIPFRSQDVQNVRTELLVILTPQVVAGGVNGGSHLLDSDTKRSIRNYSDPSGLYDLLQNHTPVKEPAPGEESLEQAIENRRRENESD